MTPSLSDGTARSDVSAAQYLFPIRRHLVTLQYKHFFTKIYNSSPERCPFFSRTCGAMLQFRIVAEIRRNMRVCKAERCVSQSSTAACKLSLELRWR